MIHEFSGIESRISAMCEMITDSPYRYNLKQGREANESPEPPISPGNKRKWKSVSGNC